MRRTVKVGFFILVLLGLCLLPSAMAQDEMSLSINDPENLCEDRFCILSASFQSDEEAPEVSFTADGALFDDQDQITVTAEEVDEGEYLARVVMTVTDLDGGVTAETSDGKSASLSFQDEKDKSEENKELVCPESDEPEDENINDETSASLMIGSSAEESLKVGEEASFSALLYEDGKSSAVKDAVWKVTLDDEDIIYTLASDGSGSILVTPDKEGTLMVETTVTLEDDTVLTKSVSLTVSEDTIVPTDVTIEASPKSEVEAGNPVTFSYSFSPAGAMSEDTPVWVLSLDGKEVYTTELDSFSYSPDQAGKLTVSLTVGELTDSLTLNVTASEEEELQVTEPEITGAKAVYTEEDLISLSADSDHDAYSWQVVNQDGKTVLTFDTKAISFNLTAGDYTVSLTTKDGDTSLDAKPVLFSVKASEKKEETALTEDTKTDDSSSDTKDQSASNETSSDSSKSVTDTSKSASNTSASKTTASQSSTTSANPKTGLTDTPSVYVGSLLLISCILLGTTLIRRHQI